MEQFLAVAFVPALVESRYSLRYCLSMVSLHLQWYYCILPGSQTIPSGDVLCSSSVRLGWPAMG